MLKNPRCLNLKKILNCIHWEYNNVDHKYGLITVGYIVITLLFRVVTSLIRVTNPGITTCDFCVVTSGELLTHKVLVITLLFRVVTSEELLTLVLQPVTFVL